MHRPAGNASAAPRRLVYGVPRSRLLPIFPLPVVLFPGVPLPLHIFEPRYRRLLAECLAGNRQFGMLYCPAGVAEEAIARGQVGCVARIESAEQLPDGRSNIVVMGAQRFVFEGFVDSPAPYHVGTVVDLEDRAEPTALLEELAERVRETFTRVGRAARTIANDTDPLPPLQEDPSLLAFGVAAMIDMEAEARQRLLASRSAGERLEEIHSLLVIALRTLEPRAAVHERAKSNGRGPFLSAEA